MFRKRNRRKLDQGTLSVESLESRTMLSSAILAPANLVGWFRGENNADDSISGLTGSLNNGANFGVGWVGRGFNLDGFDDFVESPDSPDWAFGTDDFTIELWAKLDSTDGDNPFVANDEGDEGTNKWIFGLRDGLIQFRLDYLNNPSGPIDIGTTPFAPTPDTWHHIAITRSGDAYTFFVDGVAGNSVTNSIAIADADAPLRIGTSASEGAGFVDGVLDEVGIYRRALSADEIQSIVDSGRVGKATIVVDTNADVVDDSDGVTSLREAILLANATRGRDVIGFNIPSIPTDAISRYLAENNANDSLGSNHGTLENGVSFAPGRNGQAFNFDGVDDQVVVPHHAVQNFGSQMTVEAWVNTASSGHGRPVVQKRSSGNVGGFTFETTHAPYAANNGLQFIAWIGNSVYTLQTPANVLELNTWQHVAATYDGTAMKIFVDGIETATLPASGAINSNPDPLLGDPIVIGRNVVIPSFAWQGMIDDIGFFHRALSAAELLAISTGTIPAPFVPLIDRSIHVGSTGLGALPTITDRVIIDGYTQPGTAVNTDTQGFNGSLLVEIKGDSAGPAVGLDIAAGPSTVRGLVINGFSQEAIVLRTGDGNVVAGNFLGTDTSGNIAIPNRGGMISYLGSDANRIGGANPADRNVISGNLWNGIELNGIALAGFDQGSSANRVQGNFIGTNAAGTTALGNGIHGVYVVSGSFGNTIGGAAVAGNRIAFNAGAGIKIEVAGSTSTVLGNSIFANVGLGIDLDNSGVTPNDPSDADSGPNGLQNFPVINLASSNPAGVVVAGSLDAQASTSYRLEFFATASPGSGGVGRRLLAVRNLTAVAAGNTPFSYQLGFVPNGLWITATATRLDANGVKPLETSEFSIAKQVTLQTNADLSVTVTDSPDPVFVGAPLTYTITVTNHGPIDATGVVVTDTGTPGSQFGSVTIPVGDLANGASRSFEIVIYPGAAGTLTNTAVATANEVDPVAGNNTFTASTLVQRVPPPVIELAQTRYEVREGDPFAVLTVRRTGDLTSEASVEFRTVNGSAGQRGISTGLSRIDDFTTTSGELFFRSRSNVATIRVPIGDDGFLEPDEFFSVVLSNPSPGAELGTIISSEVIIHDNDPTLSFVESSSERGEGMAGRGLIEVRLQPASNQTVSVAYSVVSGNAALGIDFILFGRTLEFPVGVTRRFINLSTVNDKIYEGDESATIELSSPTNAFLGTQLRHSVKIIDNDPQPPPIEPGSTPDTALFIDLQTLPRQSFRDVLAGTLEKDTFRVRLGAGERLALDVDPESIGDGQIVLFPGILSSTLVIIGPDKVTELARIGRSAEPDTGNLTNNAATLFQATAAGDYYVRLETNIICGYRLHFHRLGVSENVPSPEQLNVPGPMYAWFQGSASPDESVVGITGPTGYGFTLKGPWQHRTTTSVRSALSSQTLTLPTGSQFTLTSPQGIAIPLLAFAPISFSTLSQRWGDVLGVVSTPFIEFPIALDIAPINDLLTQAFGSEMASIGGLFGPWRISLGGSYLFEAGANKNAPVDEMLAGVPYLREKGPIKMIARFGPIVLDFNVIDTPIEWIFDPADPMLYVKVDKIGKTKEAALALSKHGLIEYVPQDAPNPLVDAGMTQFYGQVYGTAIVPFKIGPLPMEVEAEVVLNVDANRDGLLLGDLGDVADVFDVLKGDFSEVREILNDVQFGANGTLVMSLKTDKDGPLPPNTYSMEAGRASVVLDGLEETIWVRGQQGGDVLSPPFLKKLNTSSSIVTEGLINWDGDFLLATTTTSSAAGITLEYGITITNEGITAHVTGSIGWNAEIDYLAGTVSGKATATITANIAIEIDDNGEVYLVGSISARGKLTASINGNSKELFDGDIGASVRSGGFKFEFPRGVGSLNFDIF